MNKEVFVRSKNSVFTISLNRIISLISFFIIGIYLNLILNNNFSISLLLKTISYPLVGIIIGALVNFIFTKREKKDSIIDILFSSFHIEYGLILGLLMTYSVNIIIFSIVVSIIFIITKLIDIKVNTVALTFIIIYLITKYISGFDLIERVVINNKDYIIGNYTSSLFTSGLLSLIIALFILKIKSSSKLDIIYYTSISYIIIVFLYGLITKSDILNLIFLNNYLFVFMYVASDSISSSYTLRGVKVYGILVGILSFILSFKFNILSPFISILFISLFHTFIDKCSNKLFKNKINN